VQEDIAEDRHAASPVGPRRSTPEDGPPGARFAQAIQR